MHHLENYGCGPSKRKQQGFSLVAAFIVIAILMAVVAYFVAGQGLNTSQTGTYNNSARASSIISQGAYLQGGVNLLFSSGSNTVATMTFDTAANTGLFNPSSGGVQEQVPDLTSFASTAAPDGIWIYRPAALMVPGVSTGSGAGTGKSYGVVLTGLKQSVCQQINVQLHGASAGIPAGGVAIAAVRGASLTAPYATDNPAASGTPATNLSGAAALDGWDKGCFQTSDATPVYVYYNVLVPQ